VPGCYKVYGQLGKPNEPFSLKPFKPWFVNQKWHVGFLVFHDIVPGEELTWGYGVPPEGHKVAVQNGHHQPLKQPLVLTTDPSLLSSSSSVCYNPYHKSTLADNTNQHMLAL